MIATTLVAMTVMLGVGPAPVTDVRPIADVVEIRVGMLADHAARRDQVRSTNSPRAGEVVGEMGADGRVQWRETDANDRARLGGEDAPALIYVRALDGVFAIDPFEPLPTVSEIFDFKAQVNVITARQLFDGSSLETDRTLFDRRRIERTQELFGTLERARQAWLRDNGYYGGQVFTNGAVGSATTDATLPEPAGRFQRPDDMPRGKSREHVQASPKASQIAQALTSSGEPIRISLPTITAAQAEAALARIHGTASNRNSEVASRD